MKPDVEKGLYEVLGVGKEASQAEIRKAYMKLALKLHPDKNPGDEVAKERFQTLQRIYAVLSDPERRKIYDATGNLEDSEELGGDKFNDLYDYYRSMFKEVTKDDIIDFENNYRGSNEESRDLLNLFTKHKGNMPVVFEWMLCSRPDKDSHRFADAIEAAAGSGEVKLTGRFRKWAATVREKPAPKNPLKPSKAKKQAAASSATDLVAMIRGKAEAKHTDFMAALEAKYSKTGSSSGSGAKKSSSKRRKAEPSEDDFAAAQARLKSGRGKK